MGEDDLISSFFGDNSGDSSSMVSPYPSVAAASPASGMVSPYPSNYGGGASPIYSDPATAAYMNMLGIPTQSGLSAVQPGNQPAAQTQPASNSIPGIAGFPQGSLAPVLGLGISGQKANQNAWVPQNNQVNYSTPTAANPTGKGTGTASIPITALLGAF